MLEIEVKLPTISLLSFLCLAFAAPPTVLAVMAAAHTAVPYTPSTATAAALLGSCALSLLCTGLVPHRPAIVVLDCVLTWASLVASSTVAAQFLTAKDRAPGIVVALVVSTSVFLVVSTAFAVFALTQWHQWGRVAASSASSMEMQDSLPSPVSLNCSTSTFANIKHHPKEQVSTSTLNSTHHHRKTNSLKTFLAHSQSDATLKASLKAHHRSDSAVVGDNSVAKLQPPSTDPLDGTLTVHAPLTARSSLGFDTWDVSQSVVWNMTNIPSNVSNGNLKRDMSASTTYTSRIANAGFVKDENDNLAQYDREKLQKYDYDL
ncbi:hypothetical protein TRVA0_005S00848 [Trichomonascus vanleenenianus]|uniref:uncharacterized protein n=1 Tax=Trichomonascus vanleenenianus TaxID=2268995 RepID=UPI003ECA6BF1